MEEKQKKTPVFVEETERNSLVLIKGQKCLGLHRTDVFQISDEKWKHLQL